MRGMWILRSHHDPTAYQRRPDRRGPGGPQCRPGSQYTGRRLVSERPNYQARTRRNIEDSDGTLILNLGALDGGTALTARHAHQIGKPCLIVALEAGIEPAAFREWLAAPHIAVLNIAGPRESKRPGVYAAAVRCLEGLLRERLRSQPPADSQ
mgnify:CR=1 FL=1